MPEKNIMTIHVGPTGRKVFTDNLEMNQNSSNNVLELFCEGKYEFVQVFYTFPDGKTTYKHHMIPDGFDKDKSAYKFHDNIDKAVTSFVIPNVTANLKVSFIGYYKNDLNQYTPVGINDFLITVIRVNNNEVYDQTYNGSDVVNIWKNINNLNALLVDLNPDYKPTTLEDLKAKVDENYNELNTRLDSVPNIEDVYNKETINQMFGTVYKYGGSVDNFSDLPTNYTNEQTGIVINVRNPNGMNYVWTGSEWDALGGFDETKYYDKEYIDEAIRVTQLKAQNETAAVDNKVNTLSATHSSDTSALRNDITQINAQFSNYYNKSDIDGKVSEVTASVSELSTRVDGIEPSANDYTDQKVGALTQTFNNYTTTTNSRINQLESKVTSVYTLKGSCTYEELTAKTENSIGDVWNVTDKDSQNYVWTGSEWDTLGSVADFSAYAKTSEVTAQIEAAENRLNGSIETTFNGLNTELQALTATVSTNKTSTETAINNLSNDTVHINTFEAFKTSNNAAISAVDTRVTNLTSSVNTALSGKANSSDVYTKNETDNAISTSINALIDGAPDTLDTLKELADAVNSNKSLVETLNEAITNKQDTLVSGTNIKTVNGVSILGTGNIAISGGVGIDDSTISTSSTYSSSKIDSTYLKAPEGRLDIENGRVNLKNNINSVYSITNNEVVMELNDDGLRYHDNATNREVNITPYYGAIDQNVDPATIKVNGIGLARETDLNKKVSLRGDTMTGNLNAPAFTVDSTKVASGDKPLIDGAINFKYKNTNDEAWNAWLTMLPSGQLQFGSQGAIASEIGTVATQEWVNKKITNAYIYKGSVDTYDALPSGADPGFVYNVRSNGANYAWTGTEWDELGATVNLDIYALKTDLNGKQDKLVSGTNIKTINGESILGTGDITISSETVGGSVGYYDTITKISDGTYTITRQTGYLTINTEDITRGSNETVNSANAYVYAYSSKKVSNALYDWDAIIGISNNGFEVKCVDSDWIGANKISINSTANQICIGFSSPKTQAEIQALCPIYVQYKLATATTEKVEEKHYARYNERFILEHNRTEAGEAVNLLDLSNITDDSSLVDPEVIFSYENGGMIIPCGAETGGNNVALQKYKNNSYISYLGSGEFAEGFNSITFQKTSDFNQIRIKRNGSKKDYGATFNVNNLEDGKTYTISADVQLRNNTADRNIYCFHIMIVEGTKAVTEYYHYNAKKHISNNEAVLLKNEAERSANLWDEITESGTLSGDDGSLETNSARLRSKNFIPISPNTQYIFNKSYVARINFYGSSFNFISTWVNNKRPFVTPSNAYFIKFDINSDYGTTYKNDIILNEGPIALPYQPYEGKVIHDKDLKNASTTLGYYDTITENPDGSYTITKQTGYVNGKDFLYWGMNGAGNRYVTFDHIKANRNIENIIGNCGRVGPDSWWQSTFTQVTITYDGNNDFLIILLPYGTAENDSSPLNDIHIQYKLATATTEKIEKNHYARYNERFILEHNKSEAERSANLLNIDDVGSKTINGITYSIKDGVITLNGTATDNVLFKAFCNIKANQSYYLKIFDSPINIRSYYSNDVNAPFGTLIMHAKEKLFTPTTDVKCVNFWIWKGDVINATIKPMLVEGSTSPITYQPYNQNKHITNNEALFLKTESDRSANLFDINTVTIGNGYDYTATATDWVKAINIPVEPNTTYTASYPIGKYAFNHGNIVAEYNKNTITTGNDTTTLSLFMYVGDYSGTVNAWFSNYMLNEGPIALPYQPYSGAPIHKKEFDDFKNSMKFIPYIDFAETSTSKDISENGAYFVIPTDPSHSSIKLEVKAGPDGSLQTAYFSGGIISVYRNYDRRFQVCEAKIVYGAGSTAASTFISDGHNYSSLPSGILTRITGKCKIYKLN